jgi:hypothetical protein
MLLCYSLNSTWIIYKKQLSSIYTQYNDSENLLLEMLAHLKKNEIQKNLIYIFTYLSQYFVEAPLAAITAVRLSG